MVVKALKLVKPEVFEEDISILIYLKQGLSKHDIAEKMNQEHYVIHNKLHNLKVRFNVSNIRDLLEGAIKYGFISN